MTSRRRRRCRQPTSAAPRAEKPTPKAPARPAAQTGWSEIDSAATPKPGAAERARRWQAIAGVAGLGPAFPYSSLLLAGPLGSTLDPTTSYVSELGTRTQDTLPERERPTVSSRKGWPLRMLPARPVQRKHLPPLRTQPSPIGMRTP
jgi:hypothetical protein